MKKKYWGFIFVAVLLVAGALFAYLFHHSHAYGEEIPVGKSGESYTHHSHVYGEEIPVGKSDKGYMFLKICEECGEEAVTYYDAMLTFVDDDAKMQAMLHWEKIIDETGIEMTAAIIPSWIKETTNYDLWWANAGWDLLDRLYEKGVDFVNHTYSHTNLTTFTEEEIYQDLQKAKSILREHGIESNILVYPNNAYNDTVVSVVDDYFDAAFACENDIITDAISKNFSLSRMNINDKNVKKVIEFDTERIVECYGIKPLESLQADMKQALDQKGWLVYMVHAYDSPGGRYFFDEESEQTIIDFCRYVQTLDNVKIITLSEGLAASSELSSYSSSMREKSQLLYGELKQYNAGSNTVQLYVKGLQLVEDRFIDVELVSEEQTHLLLHERSDGMRVFTTQVPLAEKTSADTAITVYWVDKEGTRHTIYTHYGHPLQLITSANDYLNALLQLKNISVLMAVKDEASTSISPQIVDKMHKLGLITDLTGQYCASYTAVITKDGVEEKLDKKPVKLNGKLPDGVKYRLMSSGLEVGKYASIKVDGKEYAVDKRGINIVVYDHVSQMVIDSISIDTYWNNAISRITE
ncbi:MAG: polysaccharide deacetylase family protein [Clostridia bacterium]|nr:polysaccharide deacetylase family protein [Clostridia bacterium]